jgi:hypothetical protein
MTELQAVNRILRAINQSPVAATGSGVNVLVDAAEDTLDEVKQEVQGEGWWYNTEHDVEVDEAAGVITLTGLTYPVLAADATDQSKNYVKRGSTLYDLDEHTNAFDTGTTVKLSIIWDMDWGDMPELVSQYIAARAASRVAETFDRDRVLLKSLQGREEQLRRAMLSEDERQADANFLQDERNTAAGTMYGGRGPIEQGWI